MLVTGRRRGRWLGWKAEVVQNFLGRFGFLDCCEHAYRTATSFTYRNVDVEGTFFILHLPQWNCRWLMFRVKDWSPARAASIPIARGQRRALICPLRRRLLIVPR